MLVLTRRVQEQIRIGDDITITVLKLKGSAVRIGIEAPAAVPVLRGEIVGRAPAAAQGTQEAGDEAQTARVDAAGRGTRALPAAGRRGEPRADTVLHARAPRSRVATVLPRMLGDAAPLRTLLDRRSGRSPLGAV